jgi:ubiquinone/menaquinone biosynthesis C-methylase UbiE
MSDVSGTRKQPGNMRTPRSQDCAATDAGLYKESEEKSWDRFSRTYTKVALPEFHPYGRRLIEMSQLRRGMWVLDVATGPGEPALSIARRIGTAGTVVAIDFSMTMLRAAAARARKAGIANVRFHRMDAERLDLADMMFDRAFCRFGLMLMPNAERALAEIHRVLLPGGRLAVAVWSSQQKVNTLGIVRAALARHDAFHPPPGAPDFFRFGKAGALAKTLRHAGFQRIQCERMTVDWVFSGPAEFWNSMKQGPSLKRALSQIDPATRRTIKHEVLECLDRFVRGGKLRIPNEAVLAVATKWRRRLKPP